MKTLAALLLTLLILVGCGESLEKKLIGTWKVDISKTVVDQDPEKTPLQRQTDESILKATSVTLKSDKTFEMEFVLGFSGMWDLKGDLLTLTPVASEDNRPNLVFQMDSTGTVMTLQENKGVPGRLVLMKAQ